MTTQSNAASVESNVATGTTLVTETPSPTELLDQMALALANVPDPRRAPNEHEKQQRLKQGGAIRDVRSELHGRQVGEMRTDLTRERDAVATIGDDPALMRSRHDAREALDLALAFMRGEPKAGSAVPPAITAWLREHNLVSLPRLAFIETELAAARAQLASLTEKVDSIRTRWRVMRQP